jgi:hypothetical protein
MTLGRGSLPGPGTWSGTLHTVTGAVEVIGHRSRAGSAPFAVSVGGPACRTDDLAGGSRLSGRRIRRRLCAGRPNPNGVADMDNSRTLKGYASRRGSAPGSGVTRPARPGRPTWAYPPLAPAISSARIRHAGVAARGDRARCAAPRPPRRRPQRSCRADTARSCSKTAATAPGQGPRRSSE